MSSFQSFDPFTIGGLVAKQVQESMHLLKLASNITLTPDDFGKQIGTLVTNELIQQKMGVPPDAEAAYHAAARRYHREQFGIDNVDSLLNGLYTFCLQIETMFKRKWEGSDGSQTGGGSYDDGIDDRVEQAYNAAAAERAASNGELPRGMAGTNEGLSYMSQQLAKIISRAGERIEQQISMHSRSSGCANLRSGMDATALREQILANVRRLARLGSAHPTPEFELIIDKDGTFYVATVVAVTHTSPDKDMCRIRETNLCRGLAAETAIDALQSLFDISMKALEDARAHLESDDWLVDRRLKFA